MSEPEGMSRAEQARAKRRAQIIEVGKEIIAERGYHATSIQHVINAAGIARGTFYLYFESKQQLLDSILAEALSQLRARIKRIDMSEGAAPPETQLRDSLSRVLRFVLGDKPLAKILLVKGRVADQQGGEVIEGFYREIRTLVAISLEYGTTLGLVRKCDPALVAAALVGAVRGLIEHLLSGTQDTEIAADEVVEELLRFARAAVFTHS